MRAVVLDNRLTSNASSDSGRYPQSQSITRDRSSHVSDCTPAARGSTNAVTVAEGRDGGLGHADTEALRVVEPAAPQPIHHVPIHHELRHGVLSHSLGDPDDRFDNELVGGVVAEAANQVAVDLEIV